MIGLPNFSRAKPKKTPNKEVNHFNSLALPDGAEELDRDMAGALFFTGNQGGCR